MSDFTLPVSDLVLHMPPTSLLLTLAGGLIVAAVCWRATRRDEWEGWGTDFSGNKVPRWFDWIHWGLGLGSDLRYKPRWYERRAYVMGLRDAARMVEDRRTEPVADQGLHGRRLQTVKGSEHLKAAIKDIHAHARKLLGLPRDGQSGLE